MFLVAADADGMPTLSQVLSSTMVTMNGFYAPLTHDGTIIVDGVVASCYMRDEKFPFYHWVMHAFVQAAFLFVPGKMETIPEEGELHAVLTGY